MPNREDGTRFVDGTVSFRQRAELPSGTRVVDATRTLIDKMAPGTRALTEKRTTRMLEALGQEPAELAGALLALRDHIINPAQAASTLRTLGTRVAQGTLLPVEMEGLSDAPLHLFLVIDDSPSMEEQFSLEAWLQGKLSGTKKDAENKTITLASGAAEHLSDGTNGEAMVGAYMFGLKPDGSLLIPQQGGLPGSVDTSQPLAWAKTVKTLGLDFTPQDTEGILVMLNDQKYNGFQTHLTPALNLVFADVTQHEAAYKQHQSAAIVLILSDGKLHDTPQAEAMARRLERHGAYVMTLLVGDDSQGKSIMDIVTPHHTIANAKSPHDFVMGVYRLAGVQGGIR